MMADNLGVADRSGLEVNLRFYVETQLVPGQPGGALPCCSAPPWRRWTGTFPG